MEGTGFVDGVLAKDGLHALCAPLAKLLDVTLFAVGLVIVVEWSLFHQVLLAVDAPEAVVVVRFATKLYSFFGDLVLTCNAACGALARFVLVAFPATNLLILEHKLFTRERHFTLDALEALRVPPVALVLNAGVACTDDTLACRARCQPSYDALAAKEVSLLGVKGLVFEWCSTEKAVETCLMPKLSLSTELLVPNAYWLSTAVAVVCLVLIVALRAAHDLVADVHEPLPSTKLHITVPAAEVVLVPLFAQGFRVCVKEDELRRTICIS